MSPALDMPLNRRDALASLGAVFLLLMGHQLPEVSAESLSPDDLPLTERSDNGIEKISRPLLLASIASQSTDGDDVAWRANLDGALLIAEHMTQEQVKDALLAIGDRAEKLECRLCHGLGFNVIVTGTYPDQHREYVDCDACNATGRKPGS